MPSPTSIFQSEIDTIKESGLYKAERVIVTQQSAEIAVETGQQVINFCANNYLGWLTIQI